MTKRLLLAVFLYSLSVQDGGEGQRQDIVSSMGIVGEWGAVPVGTAGR